MRRKIIIIFLLVIILFLVDYYFFLKKEVINPQNFSDCLLLGNTIEESYPRVCKTKNGLSFTEDIGNEVEKIDLIILFNPRPNDTIKSPLKIEGIARGFWFFEASFPIKIIDEDGKLLGTSIATAKGEWMTEEFVPFYGEVNFSEPSGNIGKLILEKDNPSGLSEYDDSLIIPIIFK